MYDEIIFKNEYFCVAKDDGMVYIKVFEPGYNLNDFSEVSKQCPRIVVKKFTVLKEALDHAKDVFFEIGIYKELIELSISNNKLEAYATIYMNEREFLKAKKDELINNIMDLSKELGLTKLLEMARILANLQALKPFLICEGKEPQRGNDAVIHLYEIEEAKPTLVEDGSVNHYELNLIHKVEKGDWLGERIEPTEGNPGKTVFGEIIKPLPGEQQDLVYDRKSIQEVLNDRKTHTMLTSKRKGAVIYENGVLTVCNYLEIDGKVSFGTGNIDFDGFVDIKDSVEDNFSVVADKDIQILGDLGLGAVEVVESREGSIYIRGGIAGQEKAEIICDGDLYTKFAADCTIRCKGTVNIGYYAMNANIIAKEVILESSNSRIIGGNIQADIRVRAAEIGSRAEVPTQISVKGFNRKTLREEYDSLDSTIEKLIEMKKILKDRLERLSNKKENTDGQQAKLQEEIVRCDKSIIQYRRLKKSYRGYLMAKGEGEIAAAKCMYPNVRLNIGDLEVLNHELKKIGVSYYLNNNRIRSDI